VTDHCGATRGAALVMGAAALFGTVGTARALGPDAQALPVAAARLALASVLLAAVAGALSARSPGRAPADVGRALRTPAVWAAAVGQAAFQWCFLSAVTQAGVAVGTLVAIGATPLITGALSRRVHRRWAAATGIALVGLVLLVGFGPVPDLGGLVFAFGAAASYAVYLVAGTGIAQAQQRHGLRLDTALTVVFSLAAGLLVVPALLTGPWTWLGSTSGLALTVYLAVVPTVVGYHLLNTGLRVVPAGTAATLGLTEPVVATALGAAVLGERFTAVSAVGAALVLVAVLVLVRAPARPASGVGAR
jgi:DME family drug/metabolite transporter